MRKWISIMIIGTITLLLTGCSNMGGLTKITLNEATHSVFYAPLYVALEKGYFKEEGLKIDLVSSGGADHTLSAQLSGNCEISLMGTETGVSVYNEGTADYLVDFAQLTQRAGDFLVSRDKNEAFTWENMKGKTAIGSRAGGMPQMVFEYILKKHGIDPKKDMVIVQDINFDLTSQTFASGQGDYTIEFEPTATTIELEGYGKVVASLGEESGKVPYAAFSAKKSYIEKNPVVIQGFTNAVQKGLDYVMTHTPEETAKVLQPQFSETDRDALILILTRYYEQDTWKGDLIFEEGSFTLLLDIMDEAGELLKKVPYEDIVTTEYAQKAVKE